MGGLFRVCLPQRCAAWNHPKRWEVARGDGFDPSATKWFFLQQAVTRLVPWLFTTSLGAPNSRVWRITHRDATEFRRRACRSLPEPAAVHIQSFWCHRILESPLSQKGCGTLDQVYGGLENWVFFLFPFFLISGPQLLCLEQVYSALKPSSDREPGPPESPGSEHSQVTGNPGTSLLDELPFGYLT